MSSVENKDLHLGCMTDPDNLFNFYAKFEIKTKKCGRPGPRPHEGPIDKSCRLQLSTSGLR